MNRIKWSATLADDPDFERAFVRDHVSVDFVGPSPVRIAIELVRSHLKDHADVWARAIGIEDTFDVILVKLTEPVDALFEIHLTRETQVLYGCELVAVDDEEVAA